MPCWVLPSVAAALWGLSLDAVLEQVRAGTIASKVDEGSLVVDVGPLAPRPAEQSMPSAPPPQSPRRRRARASRFAARTSDTRAAPAASAPFDPPPPAVDPVSVTTAEM